MKNLLLALDLNNSEESERLLDKTFELISDKLKVKVWIVHVAAPDPDFVGLQVGPQYIRDEKAEDLRDEHRLVQKYANQFKERGVTSEGLLIQGATAEMILQEAEKLEADVIIVGRHNKNIIQDLFYGHTVSDVIKHSLVPIYVIPLS